MDDGGGAGAEVAAGAFDGHGFEVDSLQVADDLGDEIPAALVGEGEVPGAFMTNEAEVAFSVADEADVVGGVDDAGVHELGFRIDADAVGAEEAPAAAGEEFPLSHFDFAPILAPTVGVAGSVHEVGFEVGGELPGFVYGIHRFELDTGMAYGAEGLGVGFAGGEAAEAGVHVVGGGGGAEDAGGFEEGGGFDEQVADLHVWGFGLGEGQRDG